MKDRLSRQRYSEKDYRPHVEFREMNARREGQKHSWIADSEGSLRKPSAVPNNPALQDAHLFRNGIEQEVHELFLIFSVCSLRAVQS